MRGSVTTELRTIIKLQRADSKIDELRRVKSTIPREIEAGRAGLEAAQAAVDEAEANLDALQKEARGKERSIEEAREGQLKSKGRLMKVKTNEEYTALLKEIDFAEEQVDRLEDEVLATMERVEADQAVLEELRDRLKVERERFERERGEKEAELERVGALLGEEEARRSEISDLLPDELLASYDKVRANKGGLAVVKVADGVCQGCNQRIPQQTHIEIKRDEILYFCQGCSRILFHDEEGL